MHDDSEHRALLRARGRRTQAESRTCLTCSDITPCRPVSCSLPSFSCQVKGTQNPEQLAIKDPRIQSDLSMRLFWIRLDEKGRTVVTTIAVVNPVFSKWKIAYQPNKLLTFRNDSLVGLNPLKMPISIIDIPV